jgi:hypothetical protein
LEVKTTLKPPNLGPEFNVIIFVNMGKIEANFEKHKTEISLPAGFMPTVMKYLRRRVKIFPEVHYEFTHYLYRVI